MQNFKIRKNNNKKNIFLSILFIFFIITLFYFSNNLNNFFYSFSYPIQNSLASITNKTSDFFVFFREKSNLKKNNDILEKERNDLMAEIILLKEIEKENDKLKKALDLNVNDDFNLILAEVSSYNFNEDFIVVNKGEIDGVSVGMPIINEKKVIIGSVFHVFDKFSKVTLITHKENSLFDVEVQGKDVRGVIKGGSKFSLILDLIPKEKEIKEGDFIITNGEIFPKGLPVGKIKKITKLDTELFQQVEIYPLFNPKNLKKVFIITDHQK